MRLQLLFLILALGHYQIMAQTDSVDSLMYKGYVDVSTLVWRESLNQSQMNLIKTPNDRGCKLKVAIAYYGLLNGCMASYDEKMFDEYVNPAKSYLKSTIDNDDNWAEPKALLSSIYGLEIGFSPHKGMFIGAKSNSLMREAISLCKNSPLVWKLYAGSKFFTPSAFGGDIAESILAFEKSIQMYESEPVKLMFNWIYLDALTFLGQAYLKQGQTDKAILVFEKALKAEPKLKWVKYKLLPDAQKKSRTGN